MGVGSVILYIDNAFFDYCTFYIDSRHTIAIVVAKGIESNLVCVQIKGM